MYCKNASTLVIRTSDACYHVGSGLTTPADAEVRCASIGGRLASFTKRQDVVDVRNVLMYHQARSEMWIGDFLPIFRHHNFNMIAR